MPRQEAPRAYPPPTLVPGLADFSSIFKREFSYVWNTLRRLGIQARDLEDVALDVFCLVHRQLATYDVARPLRPWLFGFAFRVASDYRRQARHRFEVAGLEIDGADPAPGVDEQLIAAEDHALIEAALQMVPLERRAVLILHEIDGCSAPAIAAALEVPLNTVYSRIRLGRHDLAAAVRELERRPHGSR